MTKKRHEYLEKLEKEKNSMMEEIENKEKIELQLE